MIGRGRKGLRTKIHVGLSGNYLASACLSEGQRADIKLFPTLWSSGTWEGMQYIIADKGYDGLLVKQPICEAGKRPIIPRRQGALYPGLRPVDQHLYRSRVAIEHFFARLKENKRLALRFDKLDITFFSFFALASLKIFQLLC